MEQLNDKYFDGRLRGWKVIVLKTLCVDNANRVYDGDKLISGQLPEGLASPCPVAGYTCRKTLTIYLTSGKKDIMTPVLIHEMAHANSNIHHGKVWLAEMTRLAELGAGTEEEIDWYSNGGK
jgi:hypothetical protein